jgi:hypothetical protein
MRSFTERIRISIEGVHIVQNEVGDRLCEPFYMSTYAVGVGLQAAARGLAHAPAHLGALTRAVQALNAAAQAEAGDHVVNADGSIFNHFFCHCVCL